MSNHNCSDQTEALVLRLWRERDINGKQRPVSRICSMAKREGMPVSVAMVTGIIAEATAMQEAVAEDVYRDELTLNANRHLGSIQRIGDVLEAAAVRGVWPADDKGNVEKVGSMVRVRAAKEAISANMVCLSYCTETESVVTDSATILKSLKDVLGLDLDDGPRTNEEPSSLH